MTEPLPNREDILCPYHTIQLEHRPADQEWPYYCPKCDWYYRVTGETRKKIESKPGASGKLPLQ